MKVYFHKVQRNPEDGWGRSMGLQTMTLGVYKERITAEEAKKRRDASSDAIYNDVSKSWIEEGILE